MESDADVALIVSCQKVRIDMCVENPSQQDRGYVSLALSLCFEPLWTIILRQDVENVSCVV